MSRQRRKHGPEFKREAVALVVAQGIGEVHIGEAISLRTLDRPLGAGRTQADRVSARR